MIVRFSIDGGPCALVDDEMTEGRMTPEVVEDYARRLREQCILAYQEITAYDKALWPDGMDDE